VSDVKFQAAVEVSLTAVDHEQFDDSEEVMPMADLDVEVATDIDELLNDYFSRGGGPVTVNSTVRVTHSLVPVEVAA
jgi:hypothetical protein